MNACSHCAGALAPTATFCGRCGAAIASTAPLARPPAITLASIGLIAIATLFLLLGALLLVLLTTSEPPAAGAWGFDRAFYSAGMAYVALFSIPVLLFGLLALVAGLGALRGAPWARGLGIFTMGIVGAVSGASVLWGNVAGLLFAAASLGGIVAYSQRPGKEWFARR